MNSNILRRFLILLCVILIFGGVAAAGFAFTQLETYAVYVDGNIVEVNGSFQTVEDVVVAANVPLLAGDRVVPPLDSVISAETAIQILRSKTVLVTTDESSLTYHTHQPTLGSFLREINLNVGRTDQIKADGKLLSINQLQEAGVPAVLEIGRFHTITIVDGDSSRSLITRSQTVGAALEEAGIILYAADNVEPAPGTWIEPNLRITIDRSSPFTVRVDGRELQTRSHSNRTVDILAAAGIGLIGRDYAKPDLNAEVGEGGTVEVVRVTEDFLEEDTPIPYESLWQPTRQLEIDTTGVVQVGQEGIFRKRTRIVYENGVEVERTPDGEWVALEPVDEILGYGTNIVIRTVDTPEGTFEYWRKVRMRVTSYTALSSGKQPGHPAYGITASGLRLRTGIVAVDKSVIPFRSDVYVPGYGVGHAADTGGGIIGRWIDLGYADEDYQSWAGYTDVYYLTPVPEPERINFLIPTTLP